jgi:hypothetical protein
MPSINPAEKPLIKSFLGGPIFEEISFQLGQTRGAQDFHC